VSLHRSGAKKRASRDGKPTAELLSLQRSWYFS